MKNREKERERTSRFMRRSEGGRRAYSRDREIKCRWKMEWGGKMKEKMRGRKVDGRVGERNVE